jgi:hypothetical protein
VPPVKGVAGGQLAEPPSPPASPESPATESPAAKPSAAASLVPEPPAPEPPVPEPPAATPPAAEPPPAEPPALDPPAPPAPPKPFPPLPPAPFASLVEAAPPPPSTPPEGALFVGPHAAAETPRTSTSPVAWMICLLPGRLGPRRCSSSMSVNGHKRAKASTWSSESSPQLYQPNRTAGTLPLLLNISRPNGIVTRYGYSPALSPSPSSRKTQERFRFYASLVGMQSTQWAPPPGRPPVRTAYPPSCRIPALPERRRIARRSVRNDERLKVDIKSVALE